MLLIKQMNLINKNIIIITSKDKMKTNLLSKQGIENLLCFALLNIIILSSLVNTHDAFYEKMLRDGPLPG